MSKAMDYALERDDLCERLGGGLPRGTLVVMEGRFGAGKSILAQRMMYGLLEHGHSASYVSTELTTAGFLHQMASLDYNVQHRILDEALVFIPSHPILGERVPREEVLNRIVKARGIYNKEVVIFDTFSKFLADHLRARSADRRVIDQIEAVLYLFKRLTSDGKTIVLTFEEGQVSPDIASIFKEAAEVYLQVQFELVGASANRRIVVQRMARAPGRFGDVIGFRVEPGVGIVIEIKSVV